MESAYSLFCAKFTDLKPNLFNFSPKFDDTFKVRDVMHEQPWNRRFNSLEGASSEITLEGKVTFNCFVLRGLLSRSIQRFDFDGERMGPLEWVMERCLEPWDTVWRVG